MEKFIVIAIRFIAGVLFFWRNCIVLCMQTSCLGRWNRLYNARSCCRKHVELFVNSMYCFSNKFRFCFRVFLYRTGCMHLCQKV